MIGVTVFFATLVTIGTLVDVTIVFFHREDIFPDTTIQLFQGFSLYRNTTWLLSRQTSSGSLDCINGIRWGVAATTTRTLSMTWVVLCHGYSLWVMSTFTNNWMVGSTATIFHQGSFQSRRVILGQHQLCCHLQCLPLCGLILPYR